MIGQKAKSSGSNIKGTITGYIKWGDKLETKYVWIKYSDGTEDLVKWKNVTICK